MRETKFKVERKVNNLVLGYEILSEDGEWFGQAPKGNRRKGQFSVKHHGALRKRQFSDLIDTLEVEIFEGDLIRTEQGIFPVVFSEGMFMLEDGDYQPLIITLDERKCEVVGDIYKTPELLKKTGDD